MAQSNDYVLDNQTPAAYRAEHNQILQAIVTNNSGSTGPVVTYPFMTWMDTSTVPPTFRIRNQANSAWIVDGLGETANRGYISAANPTMTGTVTVPTPVTTSNTTVAASTAFVVSRLASHGAWISATLLNGWAGTAFYRLNNNGTVSLRGIVNKANAPTAEVVFALPVGFRPISDYNDYNSVIGATVSTRTTVQAADGFVVINTASVVASAFISLDRITFAIA